MNYLTEHGLPFRVLYIMDEGPVWTEERMNSEASADHRSAASAKPAKHSDRGLSELQATIAHLKRQNAALKSTIEQLRGHDGLRGNSLQKLFGNADLPLLVIGADLRVRDFSPRAGSAFKLTSADCGRPLADVPWVRSIPGLPAMVSEALERLMIRTREIQNREGQWLSVRVLPYRTGGCGAAGAIIAVFDIDELKTEAMEARVYAEAIGETVGESVLVLDSELNVKAANRAFFETFGGKWEDTAGHSLTELGSGQWDLPRLRERLNTALTGSPETAEFHLAHEFPGIGRRNIAVKICQVRLHHGASTWILLVMEDVTERTRAEDSLRSSEARLRALVSSMDDIVFEVDERGKCLSAWTGNRRLMARSREERYGHSIEEFLPPPFLRPVQEAFDRVIRTNQPESVEYSLDLAEGKRWFQARINRIASQENVQRSLSILVRDVTARKAAEIALLQSEERFRSLVEGVKDYAIYALDTAGRVVSWNKGAERIKGYTREEVIGKHFSIFYPPEEVTAGKPDRDLKIAAAEGRFEDVGAWRMRKDGSRFYANLLISAIRDKDGILRGFTKITRDITDRKRAEDAVRQLSGRILRLQDEERRRIARELHDSTAQVLTALSMNLSLVAKCEAVASNPQASQLLAESEALATQASDEIRNISHLLHPPDLDAVGLVAALRWYAGRFGQRTGIGVRLKTPTDLQRLPQQYELALFRVAQESLTNVQRHSGSKVVTVRMIQHHNAVELQIEDKGRGMPAGIVQPGQKSVECLGVGIAGMRERVQQLGGQLQLTSSPRGTKVRVIIPCPPEHAVSATLEEAPETATTS